ncbi:MAG: CT398-like coiled coil hairpin domain-containing protein, partial [Microbacterium sp.]
MKASPADQRLLLDIAALDDRYDRAKRTKENPPQAARVRELVEQRTAENRVLAERVGERDALRTELTKVDSDVDLATTRRERDAKRLEQATDLATIKALEQELASLAR